MKRKAVLQHIYDDHKITRDTDADFLFTYQSALLLSLKDSGVLTEMQYRCAEERLKKQGYNPNTWRKDRCEK